MSIDVRELGRCLCYPIAQAYEGNYITYMLEPVFMVFVLSIGNHYLYKLPFEIYTDHPIRLVLFPKV